MMLIALGFNQQTLIAILFLVLAFILGGITAASIFFRRLDGAFDGLMSHMSTRFGPGVQYPRRKSRPAYLFFGILAAAAFVMFLVEILQ